VIESARSMVTSGRADLLPRLIHTDDASLRRVYDKAGSVLGSLQRLAMSIAERFPREVRRIERLADEADSTPRRGSGGLGLGFSPDLFRGSDDPINDAVGRIMADPYGWLANETESLTVTTIDDSRVAVLRNGRPILPPLGVVIEKQSDDRWAVVLPTHLPMVQRILPKNEEEEQIWLALLQVVQNALDDLREDIETGEVRTLDRAVEVVAQKVMTVAPLVLYAYGKVRDSDG